MRLNVTEQAGTGSAPRCRGYRVGGKTGTAEMPGVGGYREKAVISSFLGAFPMDNPRYVVFVLLFEPKATQGTAAKLAAATPHRPRPASSRASRRCSACCRRQAAAAGGRAWRLTLRRTQNMKLGDVR